MAQTYKDELQAKKPSSDLINQYKQLIRNKAGGNMVLSFYDLTRAQQVDGARDDLFEDDDEVYVDDMSFVSGEWLIDGEFKAKRSVIIHTPWTAKSRILIKDAVLENCQLTFTANDVLLSGVCKNLSVKGFADSVEINGAFAQAVELDGGDWITKNGKLVKKQ